MRWPARARSAMCTAVLVCWGSVAVSAQESVHASKISTFHGVLAQVLQAPDFTARVRILAPSVPEVFDLRRIAQVSVGRVWRDLDDEAQLEFEKLLTELIVSTYASRFAGDRGQSFATLAEEVGPRGTVVRTALTTADGDQVRLDYYLRDGKVFNVVADGVSDLALRRADYRSVIKSAGFDGLLSHLRAQVVELKEEN